jgi:cytochrome c oxidase subunit 1
MAAWTMAIFQFFFIVNFFWSIRKGKKVDHNPWRSTTLDWAATTSPPLAHGNFATAPEVHHGAYEYSVPGQPTDFSPQHVKVKGLD